MGPQFDVYTGTHRGPHIPNGDFQFVDRMVSLDRRRGDLSPGAVQITEYDSPPGAWYDTEGSFDGMPNCVLLESSLQAAILCGYHLGATLGAPEQEFSIRNLDGHATLLRPVDLRGRTIRQRTTMLSSEAVPGAILQNFAYELAVGDEVFYTGESLFGYFAPSALANQVGLDGGRYVAPWSPPEGAVRRALDLSGPAYAAPGLRLDRGRLRLVDGVEVVDGGGTHGIAHLLGRRRIDPGDWYFDRHFHRDPVMPGSLGVQAVLQTLQAYVIDARLADGMTDPEFTLPAGVRTGWSYRGQILRGDPECEFDVDVKEIRRDGDRLVVVGDANLWKPGLRIYRLTDVAVAVCERRSR
jgi:3-hydroxymyristoyl/3-hydroxydecanoyl-(acyl carrier protein) dehydratase